MQLFTVRIEQRRSRFQTVAAETPEAARRMAGLLLREGDRVLSVMQAAATGPAPADPQEGRAALLHLLSQVFVDCDGTPTWVSTWINLWHHDAARRVEVNSVLAAAGLRVKDTGALIVGTATSIPTLAEWCGGTRFAGHALAAALATIPGAERGTATFAGLRSRTIVIPPLEVLRLC